jgi:hypothetical protein
MRHPAASCRSPYSASGVSSSPRAAAPGRPKQGPLACRETRQAFMPSTPARAGMEPRHSLSEGRSPYSASGVWS